MSPSFLALILLLGAASYVDIRERRIPNRLLVTALGTACLLNFFGFGTEPWLGVGWALVLGVPLLSLSLARPHGFGAGDAKLMIVTCVYLGGSAVFCLLSACVLAFPVALISRQRGAIGIPFAPFVAAGALASVVLG